MLTICQRNISLGKQPNTARSGSAELLQTLSNCCYDLRQVTCERVNRQAGLQFCRYSSQQNLLQRGLDSQTVKMGSFLQVVASISLLCSCGLRNVGLSGPQKPTSVSYRISALSARSHVNLPIRLNVNPASPTNNIAS